MLLYVNGLIFRDISLSLFILNFYCFVENQDFSGSIYVGIFFYNFFFTFLCIKRCTVVLFNINTHVLNLFLFHSRSVLLIFIIDKQEAINIEKKTITRLLLREIDGRKSSHIQLWFVILSEGHL